MQVTEMVIEDFAEVHKLWSVTDGVGLTDCDTPEGIASYLKRNPGMSFVAREAGGLVGAVLCGTDGRRGYLHHLAVAAEHRTKGIGRAMVDRCLDALARTGVTRCHIFVYARNTEGQKFWDRLGWYRRDDLLVMSRDLQAKA